MSSSCVIEGRRKAGVVVQLVCMLEGHRDRHDVVDRRISEQRAVGMQGGFRVRWRETWRNVGAGQRYVCRVPRRS